jgi:siroheme synthase
LCFPCLAVSKVATPEQSDFQTTLGEFRKALPLESPAVLLIGRVFARALKGRNWNLPTEAAR